MADELYSKNQLTNPGAETGNLTGWTIEGVATDIGVASGGVGEDSNYCFAIDSVNVNMSQTKSYFTAPSDFKIAADFLPSTDPGDGAYQTEGIVKLIFSYGDGTKDEVIFPLRDDSGGA